MTAEASHPTFLRKTLALSARLSTVSLVACPNGWRIGPIRGVSLTLLK